MLNPIAYILPERHKVLEVLEIINEHKRRDELDRRLERIKKANISALTINSIRLILFGVLVLDVGYSYLSIQTFLIFALAILIVEVITSIITNLYSFYESGYIIFGIWNKVTTKISNTLDKKDSSLPIDFQTNIGWIGYNTHELIKNTLEIFFSIALILLANTKLQIKLPVFLVAFMIVVLLALGGRAYNGLSKRILKMNTNEKDITAKDFQLRWIYPAISNASVTFMPLLIIVLTKLEITSLVAQLAIITAILSASWQMLLDIDKLMLAKVLLNQMHVKLRHIEKRYVINDKGLLKTSKNTQPTKETLQKSKNGLVLKDFMPMAISNKKLKTNRNFSYHFKPGIYQLNGMNGVGKTTLLRTLTLSNGQGKKIEIPQGEIALYGKPFYEESETLELHRNKYIYIGNTSDQADPNKLRFNLFKKYKNLHQFLKDIDKSDRSHSEGEKAILLICSAYQNLLDKKVDEKLIFIDEAISRIYGDDVFGLRNEVIELIEDFTRIDKTLIIIIVDHMTKIRNAKQVRMTWNKIS